MKPWLLIFGTWITLLVAALAPQFSKTQDQPIAEVVAGVNEPRSPQWRKVRDAFLAKNPECAACGFRGAGNQVHHVIPFSVDAAGDVDGDGTPNELDPDNLITLCGPSHRNHHIDIGHGGSYRCRNLNCRKDAEQFRKMRECRTCD